MANKFQKSVLERLEQDAVRQKQKPRESKPQTTLPVEPIPAAVPAASKLEKKTQPISKQELQPPTEIKEISNTQPEPIKEVQQINIESVLHTPERPPLPDIGDYLRREPQRLAKNKTFYLDANVIAAIKSTAKNQDVTDSKLVNDILRRVLGL